MRVFVPGSGNVTLKAALLFTACDLPATRKLLGFSSYSSHYGCSKCTTYFPQCDGASKLDYSNFEWKKWVPRNASEHRKSSDKYLQCKTMSEMKLHVSEGGVQYRPFLQLSYFNPIRYHIIDPMHNLLLCTAKHVLETWLDKRVLDKKGQKVVEDIVDALRAPVDVGRIPLKIMSSFGGFTADQWHS